MLEDHQLAACTVSGIGVAEVGQEGIRKLVKGGETCRGTEVIFFAFGLSLEPAKRNTAEEGGGIDDGGWALHIEVSDVHHGTSALDPCPYPIATAAGVRFSIKFIWHGGFHSFREGRPGGRAGEGRGKGVVGPCGFNRVLSHQLAHHSEEGGDGAGRHGALGRGRRSGAEGRSTWLLHGEVVVMGRLGRRGPLGRNKHRSETKL